MAKKSDSIITTNPGFSGSIPYRRNARTLLKAGSGIIGQVTGFTDKLTDQPSFEGIAGVSMKESRQVGKATLAEIFESVGGLPVVVLEDQVIAFLQTNYAMINQELGSFLLFTLGKDAKVLPLRISAVDEYRFDVNVDELTDPYVWDPEGMIPLRVYTPDRKEAA